MKTKDIQRRKPSEFVYNILDTRIKDDELRPCPFCNGKAEIQAYGKTFYVCCSKCGAQIWNNKATTEELARLQWNIRLGR